MSEMILNCNNTKLNDRLPEGWTLVTLKEVCESRTGGTPPTSIIGNYGGDLTWLVSGDINQNEILDCKGRITEQGVLNSNARVIPADCVLIALNGQGKTRGRVALLCTEATCNQSLVAMIPKDRARLLPRFLKYQLDMRYRELRNLTGDNFRSGLSMNILSKLPILLPTFTEQQRITIILNEQLAAVDKARAAAEAQLEEAKALAAAYLREVFPRPGEELPAGWRWVKLGDVCKQDRQIIEPRSSQAKKLRYYSLEHIESGTGRILTVTEKQIESAGISTTFCFDRNHVLYGKLRPYLNKVALPEEPGRCTTELIPLRPNHLVDRIFLAWLLRRRETVEFAMQGKTGSRMPRADMDNILSLGVPLPPLVEQKRIATFLNDKLPSVGKVSAAVQSQLIEINALTSALLRKAFNGEL